MPARARRPFSGGLGRGERRWDVGLDGLPWHPSRRPEDVSEAVTPAPRRTDVTCDREVLVGLQLPDVVGIDLLGESVMRPERLWLEAAEQPVPDDQYAAVVLVEVLLVHPVVNAVM